MTWYIDSGPRRVHKVRDCAKRVAQTQGGGIPYYWSVEADSPPGWRHCHCIHTMGEADKAIPLPPSQTAIIITS